MLKSDYCLSVGSAAAHLYNYNMTAVIVDLLIISPALISMLLNYKCILFYIFHLLVEFYVCKVILFAVNNHMSPTTLHFDEILWGCMFRPLLSSVCAHLL